jgi:hypothetical protein
VPLQRTAQPKSSGLSGKLKNQDRVVVHGQGEASLCSVQVFDRLNKAHLPQIE